MTSDPEQDTTYIYDQRSRTRYNIQIWPAIQNANSSCSV